MLEESQPIIFGYVKGGHGKGISSNYYSLVMLKVVMVEDSLPLCQKKVMVEESL